MSGLFAHPWAYPALEVAHLLGIALLLGNLVTLELRAFGRGSALPLQDMARLSLGIALAGFGLAGATGLAMFATQPQELLANRAFTLKMTLLMLAGCNAAAFHARGGVGTLDAVARAQLVLSSVLWIAVLACGRWIAYR